ncbi:MAG: VOC family protein [Patescibacteria group bacterium]
MNNRVVHFEIHADDCNRAVKFYKKVFGWEITKWEGGQMEYWMVMTAPKDSKEMGINGGLLPRPQKLKEGMCGSNAFVCTMMVSDLDKIGSDIVKAGGKVAMPKFALVGMAWQAYYLDTEGNTFGIHQPDVNAK